MTYLKCYTKICALILCLAVNFSAQPAHAQATVQLSINNARPVDEAVQELVLRYGYMITYEELQNVYEGDLETEPGDRFPHPRGGTLNLTVPTSSSISTQTMASILNQLVRAQASLGGGGHFRVIQAGDVFHVVPTEVKDKNGSYISRTPILDVSISLPAGDYSIDSLIDTICKAVSSAAHVEVSDWRNNVGGIVDQLHPLPYHLQADKGPARDVMTRALDSVNGPQKLTWSLGYIYKNIYGLTVYSVPDRKNLPVTK